jgi:hypothetical protein
MMSEEILKRLAEKDPTDGEWCCCWFCRGGCDYDLLNEIDGAEYWEIIDDKTRYFLHSEDCLWMAARKAVNR